MKLPSLSRMFGPIPDPRAMPPERIETIGTIDRIGATTMGDTFWNTWTTIFEDDPRRVTLSVEHLTDWPAGQVALALARKGDRLRMVRLGDRLVEVENLDMPRTGQIDADPSGVAR